MRPRTAWLLLGILLLTSTLHLVGLRKSLPYVPEADEQIFVGAAVNIVAFGDPNPHWFGNPGSTVIYPLAAIYWLGDRFGTWGPPNSINPEFADRVDSASKSAEKGTTTVIAPLFLAGRGLTAAYGIASAAAMFFLGRRIFSDAVGLISALVLGTLPIQVSHSQVIRTDSAAVLFTVLALYACVAVYERPTLRRGVLAGLLIGLATASRYFMVTLLPVFALTSLLGGWRMSFRRETFLKHAAVLGLVGLTAAVAAFALTSPFVFLDFEAARQNLKNEARPRHLGADGLDKWSNFAWYLLDALPSNLTWPVFALMVVGFVLAPRWRRDISLVLLGFMLVFVFGISQSALHWNRWLIQALPVGVLFAAVGVVRLARLAARFSGGRGWVARTALGLGTLTVASVPLYQTTVHDLGQVYPTRVQARDWLLANAQPGTNILQEGYAAALGDTPFQVDEKLRLLDGKPDQYQASGYDYLIFSSWTNEPILTNPVRFPRENARYNALFEGTTLVAEFIPPAERLGTLPLLGSARCNCSPAPVPGGPVIQIRLMPESTRPPTDAGAARAGTDTPEQTSPGGPPTAPPDPGLYARLPGEDLAAFERRLRDLAARDLLPSGPGGRFITDAVERERQLEETSTTSP